MDDQIPLCWCCQDPFPTGPGTSRGRIWLTSDLCIPVCPECWQAIPEAQRVEIAIKFRDRGDSAARIADALESIVRALEHATPFSVFDHDQPDEMN